MTEHDATRPAHPPGEPAETDAPTAAWTPRAATVADDGARPAAEPVRPPARASRTRWAIALLVTVAIVAAGVAAVMLLTGQSAPSSIVGYAPRDSVVYGEVRLDLPGDQRQKLGEFLSKFPGFADQSTLELKLDDVLDRTVRALTEDRQDWSTKIKPWFGGQLGFAVGDLPPVDAPDQARALVIASVSDADRARGWFDELVADLPHSTDDHSGTPITLFGDGDETGAMAIHGGRTMLVGDEASVRAAIDGGGNGGFADNENFKAALLSIEGEGLGFAFIDVRRYMGWLQEAIDEMPGASAIPLDTYADLVPPWIMARLQARGDALAFETVMPHSSALNVVDENRRGVLAEHAPPSTFVLLDGHETGAAIRNGIELAGRDPNGAEMLRQVEQFAAIFGGYDGLVGWMGDGGLAIARDGTSVNGGLLFQPTDRAKAERLFSTIRSFVQLGGASAGMSIRDEDHAGATITVVDVGNLEDLAALVGGGALPPGAPLPESRLEIAWTITDDVVVIAPGPDFVRDALDAGPGPSLAEDGRYRALIDRVGAEHTASMFVDLVAIRELVETLGTTDPDAFAAYERDVKPYLLPIDAIVQATVRDGDLDRTTLIVTVK